jgi:hypothetical protein
MNNMKKIILTLVPLLFVACSSIDDELITITDSFVESLQTDYDSYGVLGGLKYKKVTSDGKYQVLPIGRLIDVKILESDASVEDYTELKEGIGDHYKNDKRVRDVYLCEAGTIMIDCRN